MIRILIVDDHELIRWRICNLLAAKPDLCIVCEAGGGFDAIRKAEEYQPDVVLLDISIPDLNGLQAAPLIKRVAPKTEILFLTQHDNSFFVREAFAAGGRGFLTKAEAASELLGAITTVHSKRGYLSKNLDITNSKIAAETTRKKLFAHAD